MGRKRPKQRAQVGLLGKDLTRRSRGRCELCASRDGTRPYELVPFPEEPSMERALMACERCRAWLEGGPIIPIEASFLESAVWAEEPAIQLAAARLLLRIDDPHLPHVRDALDAARIDPATGEFREAV
jgi:protein PhnA